MLCGWLACGSYVGGAGKRFVAPSRLRGPQKNLAWRAIFAPPSWCRDPWKGARMAGAWIPDALCRELATRCLRRNPSGRQAAGLIPRLVRRVAVDSRQEARRAWRAMRGGPQTFPRARSLTPRRSRDLFLMLSVSQGGGHGQFVPRTKRGSRHVFRTEVEGPESNPTSNWRIERDRQDFREF